jgi:hypothetical protein
MLSFGAVFTPTIDKRFKDTLLPSNLIGRKDKPSTFKMFFKRRGPFFRVMTTFSFRSHLFDGTSPTARGSEDRNLPREVHEERTAMTMLQDATDIANLPLSMNRTRTTKKLLLKLTTTIPPEDGNPRRESRHERCGSRTISAKKTGSWRT